MEKPKPTTGWTVGFTDGSGPDYVLDGPDGKAVARLRWGCGCCENRNPLTDEEKSRARLISAAPELLAVVKDFRQKLATYTSVYEGDKELRRQLKDCDDVIAKAESGR